MTTTLQISQQPTGEPGRYRIQASVHVPGQMPLATGTELAFALDAQDRQDLRWYLEDYLEHAAHPAPAIALRIEGRMRQIGEELFRGLFQASDDARELWTMLRPHLAETRIEIATDVAGASAIPWELTRDPRTGAALALAAQAFVRVPRGAVAALTPTGATEKVRILLVICRPGGRADVPFRSVASRLVKGLDAASRDAVDLDVLRPPSFEQLAAVLRAAKQRGAPYHIVHFDGHGVYADPADLEGAGRMLSSLRLDAGATGRHGYLMFEEPEDTRNAAFVDGPRLGALLAETRVPLLVLNACQSATADAANSPEAAKASGADVRQELAAYGSLAQEVVDAGAAGVVAMRYSVWVVTAAQFVAELYGALASGLALGEAVSRARKNLADDPVRHVYDQPRPLQDWCVPVVWERAALRLWPQPAAGAPLTLTLDGGGGGEGALDPKLPPRPDVGFHGRDETLLALDRGFDKHRVVLLHAFAGAGKTATAAEFARWYALTGGVADHEQGGPVLFSSFEHHLPLPRLLDRIGEVFGGALEQAGLHWDAITDERQRRDVALQVLQQIPLLWIWDNVEPVTGFPAGSDSDWSRAEQDALRDFLRAAAETKAKVLLTSRRDEHAWLGLLPARIPMPAMPKRERRALAEAIAAKHGRRMAELPDLTPLLDFSQGNPLTLTVAVGEALRAGVRTEAQVAELVARLRAGEAAFEDEVSEGRSRSLGASLSYGFEHAFTDDERRILALLHLFQGFVDVDVLRWMGDPEAAWCLEAVREMTRERGIALLDRAAEVGLLAAHGNGYYTIHPALPWYFRALFDQHYPAEAPTSTGDAAPATRARRAFVEAMGDLGNYYHRQYNEGNRQVLSALMAEEDNLLAAWRLARTHSWWRPVIAAMQGLRQLYDHTGRRAAWRRLVDTVVPEFVDPATDGPLPGREEDWSLVTDYRVRIAGEERRWPDAERLQRARVAWDRRRAEAALAVPPDRLDAVQHHAVRSLAASLHELGQILREQGDPGSADTYREAMELARRIGDRPGEAICAFNLGHVYKNLDALRDLDAAERWYRQSLDLRDPRDALGRGGCLAQLGSVAYARFQVARKADQPEAERLPHLQAAADFYQQALGLIPETAVDDRAVAHNQLGGVYWAAGDLDHALSHCRQAIRLREQQGNLFAAGQTRRNVALALWDGGRFGDALLYARAALDNFAAYGDRAAEEIDDAKRLIADIEQTQRAAAGG